MHVYYMCMEIIMCSVDNILIYIFPVNILDVTVDCSDLY